MLIHRKGNLIDLAEAGEFHIIVHGCNCRYSAYLITEPTRFLIVNAYTQIGFSPRNMDHFEYASFEVILKKMAHEYGPFNIGLPYIGMGLAGGNKDIIIPMIEDFAEKITPQGGTVTLVEFA